MFRFLLRGSVQRAAGVAVCSLASPAFCSEGVVKSKPKQVQLFHQQQATAISLAYNGQIESREFASEFPLVAKHKKGIYKFAKAMPDGLVDDDSSKALTRASYRAVGAEPPAGCYTTAEMRGALLEYYQKLRPCKEITEVYGPSRITLWKHEQKVSEQLETMRAGGGDVSRATGAEIERAIATLDFPSAGKPPLLPASEEHILLEMSSMAGEHGAPHGQPRDSTLALLAACLLLAATFTTPGTCCLLACSLLSRPLPAHVRACFFNQAGGSWPRARAGCATRC